jgi:hypothetical protein
MALRAEILDQKVADVRTSPGARAVAQSELDSIQRGDVVESLGAYAEPDREFEHESKADTEQV